MTPGDLEHLAIDINPNGIATISLNRPDKMNAVNGKLHKELSLIFRYMEANPAVEIMILTGAGRAFSAGGDIGWMQESVDEPQRFDAINREAKEIIASILDCEKPIIAKVNGYAVGLGATLALFCDVIFAADTAKFGDPHVAAGLVAGDGGAVIWPQLIGYAKAKEFLMTGDLLTAAEAERIGLINHVVPADQLDAAVDAFAQKLLNGSTRAIRWTKAAVIIPLRQIFNSVIDASLAFEWISNASPDHREAVAAFRERRPPQFQKHGDSD